MPMDFMPIRWGFMIRVKVIVGLMCFKYIKGVVSGRETRESEKTIQWWSSGEMGRVWNKACVLIDEQTWSCE